ncbi:MAG: hypothetical protein LBR92_02110 [Puniceicoccales bacterium]|jgi:hypothetical protein|nr:hypothetical protein [Puniceicoccales bacterium]
MLKKIDHFSYILVCSVMLGDTLLEANPKRKVEQKPSLEVSSATGNIIRRLPVMNFHTNPQTGANYKMDPTTGIRYMEFKKIPSKTPNLPQKTIVETMYPNGETLTWEKNFFDARTVFSSESLTKRFNEEDFFASVKTSIRKAIVKQSVKEVKEILETFPNPQDLLKEIRYYLAETNASGEFRKAIMNMLVKLGCSS